MADDPKKSDPSANDAPDDGDGKAPILVIGIFVAMFVALVAYGFLTNHH